VEFVSRRPAAGWLEVHSENYFSDGGVQVRCLLEIRADYPLSLHGVGLSLGSTDELNRTHLAQLKRAERRFAPGLVSEHLSWSSVGGRFANDLLPLPYTEEACRHVAARIAQAQDHLGRQILIENVSSYMTYASSTMSEWAFLSAVAAESGCGILLDVNNIYVSAHNHGFAALDYINGISPGMVGEIHVAGYSEQAVGDRTLLIDTHGAPVSAGVWALYASALERFGAVPTLIEWDTDVPELQILAGEAEKISGYLNALQDVAA
jgi:uncharacterized protein (UPF0276 family)